MNPLTTPEPERPDADIAALIPPWSPEGPPEAHAAEGELLRRLHRGEEGAFAELVRRHAPSMLAAARSLLRCEEEARVLVQEAFRSAFRDLPGFRGGSTLGAWLRRLLVDATLRRLRTTFRLPETAVDEWLPRFNDDGGFAAPVRAWPNPADSALASAEVRGRVRAAFETLPLPYRSVLTLRDLEGLDPGHVARLLQITPADVEDRLHRARQALRTKLEAVFLPAASPAG
jgi:RNA polymerase sigma-70 factor (ECF subfamily)